MQYPNSAAPLLTSEPPDDEAGEVRSPPFCGCNGSEVPARKIVFVLCGVMMGIMLVALLYQRTISTNLPPPSMSTTSGIETMMDHCINCTNLPNSCPAVSCPLCSRCECDSIENQTKNENLIRSWCRQELDLMKQKTEQRMRVRCNRELAILDPLVVLKPETVTISPMLRHLLDVGEVDAIWSWLLKRHPNRSKATVVEVGAFDCKQAIEAAELGYRVIAVEPSPGNLVKCRSLLSQHAEAAKRIELIAKAAGNTSGSVQFNADGTTGDHVGRNPGEVNPAYHTGQKVVTVPLERMDKILEDQKAEWIYILKIDTQGFDLFVLQGLERLLHEKRILYVIFEFWPTGLKGTHNRDAAEILYLLARHGYMLFDSRALYLKNNCCPTPLDTREDFTRPTVNAYKYSAWFEERDRRNNDKFGTWTDGLAQVNVDSDKLSLFYPA